MLKHIFVIFIIFLCPNIILAQGQVSRPIKIHGSNKNKLSKCEVVDLGLPSGTKWAICNIGAKNPEDVGDFYSWGEVKSKSSYTRESYRMNDLDKDITGKSAYDVATTTFGKGYTIPTKTDFEELIDNCTKNYTELNGVRGTLFVGPNGNSIFLPLTGRKFSTVQDNIIGFYWTSTTAKITDIRFARPMGKDSDSPREPKVNGAYLFSHRDSGTYIYGNERYQGNCIRPVRRD